jgi:hypothetical protein
MTGSIPPEGSTKHPLIPLWDENIAVADDYRRQSRHYTGVRNI